MPTAKRKRGARVAQARQRAGLSQEALAARAGTARSTVARVEIGTLNPSVDVALAIAAELGESVEALFGGDR